MTPPLPPALPLAAHKLIPHRAPMLLIDQLTRRRDDVATATARLTADSLFFGPERLILPEYYIEIMAQTMAAANGFDALQNDNSPRSGFIVGIDGFRLHHRVEAPAEFSVEVATTMEFGAMKVMEATVTVESTRVASAEIKVWEQPEEED